MRKSIKQKKKEGWPEPEPYTKEWYLWTCSEDFEVTQERLKRRYAYRSWDNESTRLFSGI